MINSDAFLMAQKFRDAEIQAAQEYGGFYLFGLFEREQIPGRWDVVASAPWLKTDREGTHHLLVALREKMNLEDWKLIGAVIPLEPSSFFVSAAMNLFHLKHQVEEVNELDPSYQGTYSIRIGHAFLITADAAPAPAAQAAAPELAAA